MSATEKAGGKPEEIRNEAGRRSEARWGFFTEALKLVRKLLGPTE